MGARHANTGAVVRTDVFRGYMGEVRLRSGALSDEWLAAEFANQSDPASFYALGPADLPGLPAPRHPVTRGSLADHRTAGRLKDHRTTGQMPDHPTFARLDPAETGGNLA